MSEYFWTGFVVGAAVVGYLVWVFTVLWFDRRGGSSVPRPEPIPEPPPAPDPQAVLDEIETSAGGPAWHA